ncbi:YccF domain-containing protein [bacterium]|nr:YccF domain-containing protein [bacterium]
MELLGNFFWIILGGGIFIFFWYLIGGLVLCCTIIGIPFGVQCIKLSILALMPFGREIRDMKSATSFISLIMNILWILIGGIELVITHLILAVILAITIIGIPFAKQHLKLAGMALTPFGKTID